MNAILLILILICVSSYSMNQMNPKLCKNCKYFIPATGVFPDPYYGKCSVFSQKPLYDKFLVTGIKQNFKPDFYYCITSRSFNEMCGEDGKYYQPKR